GRPPLRLVPVAVARPDDVLVYEPRAAGTVRVEARDPDVRLSVAARVGVPVERRPHDVAAVRRPVGMEVVVQLAVVGEIRGLAAVPGHHPDVRAETAEAG